MFKITLILLVGIAALTAAIPAAFEDEDTLRDNSGYMDTSYMDTSGHDHACIVQPYFMPPSQKIQTRHQLHETDGSSAMIR